MKTWERPELQELTISATAQGKHVTNAIDEVRVDPSTGNYWASFTSGEDSNLDPVGPIYPGK
jgi:hypothetical protein